MGKKGLAIIAIVIAIVLFMGGLVFLIAADRLSYFMTAVVLLAIGGGVLWYAISVLRRLRELSQENLEAGIIDLARRLGGELSVAQVQAEFRIGNELALETLERLRRRGTCQMEPRAGRTVYLFKGVLPAKAVKRCPYCGSEFAVRSAIHQCPNCGGTLEITRE